MHETKSEQVEPNARALASQCPDEAHRRAFDATFRGAVRAMHRATLSEPRARDGAPPPASHDIAAARDDLLRYLVTGGFEVCYDRRRRNRPRQDPPEEQDHPATRGEAERDEGEHRVLVTGGGASRRDGE